MTTAHIRTRTSLLTALAVAITTLSAPQVRADAPPAADAAALTAHARTLIHAGKLKQANDELIAAAKLRGWSMLALYELARLEFVGGNQHHATNACKALVTKNENDVLSLVCQARAIDASHPEVLLAFADEKRVAGDFNASREAYQQVIGLDADNMEAQFGLGQLCLVIPDREAAKSAFRKVLEREPDWTEAQFELGRLSSGPEAVALLEKAAASKPDWIEARVALGVAKLGNGDAAGAEALFRDVLKKQPKNASAHSRLGMVLAAKQDFAGAESELTQGLAGAPNDADAVMALGRVYAATDRAEEAFTQFRSAASLDRQSPDALIEAGVYALKISRNALAQAFLEKAVERAPKSAMAQARYADSLLARGEKAGAKEHYKLALAGEGAIDRQDVQRRLDALK
ncbi:MAG TPA: tetratricopeptide repeat protein [Polyangiales bacterium]|nr:tetratricopeptide repeat protein [Polyangiales bacterium]